MYNPSATPSTPRPPSTKRSGTANSTVRSAPDLAKHFSTLVPRVSSAIPPHFARLAGKSSRTTQRLRDERSIGSRSGVDRVADLSDFPAHAQPVLIKSTFDQIMTGFAVEGKDFSSLSICAEVAYNETTQVTSQLPYPNPLRTAVACHLLDRLTPCGPGSTTYSPFLARLKQDVFCSIYADTSPETFHVSKAVSHEVQANTMHDVGGPEHDAAGGVSRLLNQATYYQQFHAKIKQYKTLEETFEQQLLASEKQKVVLSRVITRWQHMLIDRLFAAWRNFSRNRTARVKARGAGMARLQRRAQLRNAFDQWRLGTRDAIEERMLEELTVLKRERLVVGAAEKGDREVLRAQLERAKEALMHANDEVARLTDELNGLLLSVDQRETKIKELRDEKQFWRALSLHLLQRSFPADRSLRLPEEVLLTALNYEDDDSDTASLAGHNNSNNNSSMAWSSSLMGSDFTSAGFASTSTFSDELASMQVQRTTALFGAMLPGSSNHVTIDALSRGNPFRLMLSALPVPLQKVIANFSSPYSLLGVPPQLLTLAWLNSTIQRGSSIWASARLLHHPTFDLASEERANRVKKLVGSTKTGATTTLGRMPFRNFGQDLASGDALLMLAEALGCFVPEDFDFLPPHACLPRINHNLPPNLAVDDARRAWMREQLLNACFKGAADAKVQCAVDALYYRVVDVGSPSNHSVDPFLVCTGQAHQQMFLLISAAMNTCRSLRFDPRQRAADPEGSVFLPIHSAMRPKSLTDLQELPSPDECRTAVAVLSSVLHETDVLDAQLAMRDADEQSIVMQYLNRLSAFETKWGWIGNAVTKHQLMLAATTTASTRGGAAKPNADGSVHEEPLDAEPNHVVDSVLLESAVRRARTQVRPLVEASLKASLSNFQESAEGDDIMSALVESATEVLLGHSEVIATVWRSYATGGSTGDALGVSHTRFLLFLEDHTLFSAKYLPKKHVGWLFEFLLGQQDIFAQSMSLAKPLPPVDNAVVGGDEVHTGDASNGLTLMQFGAALGYIAASAAYHDFFVSVVQSMSSYGANAGKAPIGLRMTLHTKLKTLCGSLSTTAGSTTLDEVQATINHPDVRTALAKHHVQLMKLFVLAAGHDENPEMSLEEFMRLMKVSKVEGAQVATADLEKIFAFFAHDDGSGSGERSMSYRDFLEALVVVVQHISPSPLVPLSDRVNSFLRRREGSFMTVALSALMLKKGAAGKRTV